MGFCFGFRRLITLKLNLFLKIHAIPISQLHYDALWILRHITAKASDSAIAGRSAGRLHPWDHAEAHPQIV
jgi:hypothetical protein